MADQDLEIRVRSTADLAAIKSASDALSDLQARTRELGGGGGFLAPLPPELLTGGELGTGALSDRANELLGKANEAAGATSRIAREASLAGTNFFSAATHAAILARGLSNGHLELRAMTVLARALSAEYLAAGGAVAAIGGELLLAVKNAQEELKYQQEIGKVYDELINKAHELSQAAKGAFTEEDVTKVLQSAIPEVEKLDAKLKEMHETDISGWKKVVDFISQGANFGKGYEAQNQKRIEDQEKLKEQGEDLAFSALKQAEAHKAAVDALKAEDSADALAKVSAQIQDATEKQQGLNTKTLEGQKAYVELAKQIENLNKLYEQLQQIQTKRQSDLDTATDKADANVQAVLRNEQDSRAAKAAGQEKDAEMYQASADAFKNSLQPAQLQQLDNLHKLQDATGDYQDQANKPLLGGPVAGVGESQALINQIEENKRRFEEQQYDTDEAGPKTQYDQRAAEIERKTQIENTRKEGEKSSADKLDELLTYFKQVWGY